MKILLTGASGFIGKQIVSQLFKETSHDLILASRNLELAFDDKKVSLMHLNEPFSDINWSKSLKGCDVVIHTAARVHVMKETTRDPLSEYRKMNVLGTLHLAAQAAQAGVKRFIFISTIKVNGEETDQSQVYTSDDLPFPQDPYAVSKLEAEQGLLELSHRTGMKVVIIRPPLVYGPGVKGNFLRICKWIERGIPLPFGLINNKRSFVSVYNLVDLICTCMDHPNAANQVFLVSDDEMVSTAELVNRISKSLNKKPRLIPVPTSIMLVAGKLLGQSEAINRLIGSLQIDISKTKSLLNWKPKQQMSEVLNEML